MAVKTFEEREASGLEVDEIMLKKALSAVAQTRKMLASVGSSRENIETEKSGRNNRDVTAWFQFELLFRARFIRS